MEQNTDLRDRVRLARRDGMKGVVIFLAVALIVVGALFSGYHNYALMRRGLGPAGDTIADLVAFIPPLVLEGSILLLMLASFVWFKDPKQKLISSVASWGMLILVAINTIVNYGLNTNEAMPEMLRVYARFLVPATPLVGFAVWKILIDLDPVKRRREREEALEEAEVERLYDIRAAARSGKQTQAALIQRQDMEDQAYARVIIASAPTPQVMRMNGHRPDEAPVVLAKDGEVIEGEVQNSPKAT